MKVAIVDQDKNNLDRITNYLANYKMSHTDLVIFQYFDILEFKKHVLNNYHFDIIYIDEYSLPLSFLTIIEYKSPHAYLIIMTEDKTIMKYHQDNLLLKPIEKDAFENNLQIIEQMISLRSIKLLCYKNKREAYIDSKDIYYIESYYGQIFVYTKDNMYTARLNNLHQYDEILYKQGFLVIHKSIIINMNKVETANVNEYILDNGKILYPSVRKKYQAFKFYQQYMVYYHKQKIIK